MEPQQIPTPGTPQIPPSPSNSRHFKVRLEILAAFLAVLCVSAGYVIAMKYLGVTPEPAGTYEGVLREVTKVEDDIQEELGGKLYLSLAPVESPDSFSLDIYAFDPVSAVLEQKTDTKNREYLTSELSPDGTKMAFASYSNDGTTRTSDTALFVRDVVTGDADEIETLDPAPQKRTPAWSSDGSLLAFVARLDENSDPMIPESWTVYVKDISSDDYAERIGSGANPVFLSNGSLAVLKSDGIHRLDIVSGDSTLVLPYAEKLETNTKFDVTRDGTKLAVAEPSAGYVRVIPVTSWAPFAQGTETIIPAHAFWPTFSPLGDYLAIQTFEWSDETDNAYPVDPRLAIYSFDTNEWVMSYDLRTFVQEALFISDWK